MFTIETENYEMTISFAHQFPSKKYYAGTDCLICVYGKSPPRYITDANGSTFLHNADQYSRPFGRKLALARAIQNLVPRRYIGVRRMIWNEYFKTISPKRGTL